MGTGTLASRHNAIDMIMGLGRPLTRPNKDELESRSPTLFVASERSPESSWGSFNEIVSKIPKTRVEIRVPTLSNPSEYRTFPYDPRINRVLEKRVRGKAAHYLVEKADGKQKEVCPISHRACKPLVFHSRSQRHLFLLPSTFTSSPLALNLSSRYNFSDPPTSLSN